MAHTYVEIVENRKKKKTVFDRFPVFHNVSRSRAMWQTRSKRISSCYLAMLKAFSCMSIQVVDVLVFFIFIILYVCKLYTIRIYLPYRFTDDRSGTAVVRRAPRYAKDERNGGKRSDNRNLPQTHIYLYTRICSYGAYRPRVHVVYGN